MAEVNTTFSPSINVNRDFDKEFDYIVTSNSKQIYDQLIRNVETGVHSFSIIGSYGTGKSSFLLALKKHLDSEESVNYFDPLNGKFPKIKHFKFDYIVGKYGSLKNQFIKKFGLDSDISEDELLEWIEEEHKQKKVKGIFWVIAIDEFGKHLEYAANNNPEKELYFIQLLAEYANDSDKNLFFITTLHQAFDSYAHGLDTQQRKEWDKVRGRLKELTFNEPVEQLLHIASEFLKDDEKDWKELKIEELIQCIESSQSFPLRNELTIDLAKNLYPLDPLSGGIISLALQKYGQNERSLFTFLQSDEFLGINDFDRNANPYFNLSCVYDYLIYNHHHFLSSKYNPHYIQWNALKKSINRVEAYFDENVRDAQLLVKSIGLLNIFSSDEAKIDLDFFKSYGKIALGIDRVDELINQLEEKKIIRYRSYKKQFILFGGTDFDIEFELQNATSKVEPITNIVSELKKHFDFPFVPAKRITYESGTPRFFEFVLSEKAQTKLPKAPIDGYVNLVFQENFNSVLKKSKSEHLPILYGVFTNTAVIEDQLFKIKRTQFLIEKVQESDKVASRELKHLLQAQIEELNERVLKSIYAGSENIGWIYHGNKLSLESSKDFNNNLSHICEEVYHRSPIFKNELINKDRVSPAIYKPRKELLKALIARADEKLLGFSEETFPAEKTIYLSMLQEPGFHRDRGNGWQLGEPEPGSGFKELWNASEEFFNSTKSGKRKLTDLISILEKPSYGLKSGLIEMWIPIYLIIKQDDYALFQEEAYVPELNFDIVNLILRNPKLFEIKAFHISELKKKLFSRYRAILNQDEQAEFTNKTFVETIRPLLLLYAELNEYGRSTRKISNAAQQLRGAIKSATDPEKAFFEEFISALGFASLKDLESEKAINSLVYQMDECLVEIKNSYDRLIDRVERCILEAIDLQGTEYEEYVQIISNRYTSLNEYQLVPYQKKLLKQLTSDQPGREEWISSVAFAVLDKPLPKMDDEEEPMLLKRLSTSIHELDNLQDLSKLDLNLDEEEAFALKILPFSKPPIELNVIVKKRKMDDAKDRLQELKKHLTNDKNLNLALLSKLIEDLENHE
ncbi:MAG: hypothetical protein WD607_02395 [Candidatus Paceibacterota bacterium]